MIYGGSGDPREQFMDQGIPWEDDLLMEVVALKHNWVIPTKFN